MSGQTQTRPSNDRLTSISNAMTAAPRSSYLSPADRRRLEENLKKLNGRSKLPTKPDAGVSRSSTTSNTSPSVAPSQRGKSTGLAENGTATQSKSTAQLNGAEQRLSRAQPAANASFRIPKRDGDLPMPKIAKKPSDADRTTTRNGQPINADKPRSAAGVNGSSRPATAPPPRMSIAEALKAAQRAPVKRPEPVKPPDAVRNGMISAKPTTSLGVARTQANNQNGVNAARPAAPPPSSIPLKVTSLDDILKLKRMGLLAPPLTKSGASKGKKSAAVASSRSVAKPVSTTAPSNKWSPATVKPKTATPNIGPKPTATEKKPSIPLAKVPPAVGSKPPARGINSKSTTTASSNKSSAETDKDARLAALEAELARLRAESSHKSNSKDKKSSAELPSSAAKSSTVKYSSQPRAALNAAPAKPSTAAASSSRSTAAPPPSTGFIMPSVKRKPPMPIKPADDNTISLTALKRNVNMAAHSAMYADEYGEEDDDDMADFVVDDDEDVGGDHEAKEELDKIFSTYRKRAQKDLLQGGDRFDDRQMESSWAQIQAEEIHSKRAGLHEDIQEERLQKAQEKARKFAKESKKLKRKLKEFEKSKSSSGEKEKKRRKNNVEDDDDS